MGSPDDHLTEPFAVQEFFLDGFAGYHVSHGMMFCSGFRFQHPNSEDKTKIVQVKLIFPISSITETRAQGDAAMAWCSGEFTRRRAGAH